MDAGLFIYFPRDPGHNINFKVFDGQDTYFKKLPPPFPRINCTSPKMREKFQPFPKRTDYHAQRALA